MEVETLLKTEQLDDEIIVTIDEKESVLPEQERDGRYTALAYSKSDSHGSVSQQSPTFLIKQTQRVHVKTYGKGYNAKVHGASLNQQVSNVYINIPPEGGSFDLTPGYWVLTVRGKWSSYHNGSWVAGGIFAEAIYN